MKGHRSAATPTLRRTSLYQEHRRLGARLVPFSGWEMPVQYTGIVEEHRAVRERAGMFDVSHMGRLEVTGPEAGRFLRYLCTYDVTRLLPGQSHYTVVCRQDGGILDDVYVFCLERERYLVVANAVNADRIGDWFRQHLGPFDARVEDRQLATAMIALQGPQAGEKLSAVVRPALVESIPKRHCAQMEWEGIDLFASRTGYTGEDGFELVLPAGVGAQLWRRLLGVGVQPCGLGARDTLRLEAALPLYGNDIDTSTNPWEAGLGWVVTFDDGADFIGREALLPVGEAGPQRLLSCLKARERGVMRAGCPILHSGRQVGKVTSGGFSPTLGLSIGMGYLPPELAAAGTELTVEVRGRLLAVQVVPRPFYKRRRAT